MPSANPRINVVCEKTLHAAIAEIAERGWSFTVIGSP